jgi:uncharacterized integral membrane protein
MKRLFFVFLFLLCLALLILFSISNMETVKLNIFPNQPFPLLGYKQEIRHDETSNEISVTVPREIPVFLLIFLSVGFGFILASIFSIVIHLKDKKQINKLKKQINKNEEEINLLRMIPIKEEKFDETKENKN